MNNQQILTAVIQKAIDGGWKAPSLLKALYMNTENPFYSLEGQHIEMVRGMITSHAFAKALWGEHDVKHHRATKYFPEGWDYCTKCEVDTKEDHYSDPFYGSSCWEHHLTLLPNSSGADFDDVLNFNFFHLSSPFYS